MNDILIDKNYLKQRNLKKLILFVIFIIIITNINAQDTIEKFRIFEARFNYGAIMDHRSSLAFETQHNTPSFELIYGKQTYGEKKWEQIFNYPTIGFGVYHANLSHKTALGSIYSAFLFSKFRLFGNDKYSAFFNISLGLAYFTKIFDTKKNYYNVSIGTHINGYYNFYFGQQIQLSKKIYLLNGFTFHHYSNGNVKEPNLGINIPSANIGLRYHFYDDKNINYEQKKYYEYSKHFEYEIIPTIGVKALEPSNDPLYICGTLITNVHYSYTDFLSSGVGFSFFYDSSMKLRYSNEGFTAGNPKEYFYTGIHLSQYLKFHRVIVPIEFGYIFYTPYKHINRNYLRIGIQYAFNAHLFLNVSLKAHKMIADYVEWGIGVKLFDMH